MVAPATPATTTLSPQQQQQLQLLQKALDGPAMAPPPGIIPNYVDPPNLEKEFYIDLILCLTISVLVVSMRMWTKARLLRKVQIEDCKKLLPAFFFFFVLSSFSLLLPPFYPFPISPPQIYVLT